MQRLSKFLLVGVAIIGLSGCSTVTAAWDGVTSVLSGSSVASQAPTVQLDAAKTLTILHLGYNAFGQQILTDTKSGLLHGQIAQEVKTYYDAAGSALDTADAANKAANAIDLSSAISSAEDAINSGNALIASLTPATSK